jgi:oxygen-independent coproporphyrinogen-3 oxidase
MRVMCDFALPFAGLPAALVADALPGLRRLEADGILALDAAGLRLTEAGRRHVRHAAACFDAYLGAGAARHSAAV